MILLPRPIKGGFAFDSALKETDEPAKTAKQASQFLIPLLRLSTKLTVFFQMTWFKLFFPFLHRLPWFYCSSVRYLLTSIGWVPCRSVEEVGWGAQGCHARVSVAIHASGDRAVAALLGSGAGDIAMRRHTACTPTETYRWGRRDK